MHEGTQVRRTRVSGWTVEYLVVMLNILIGALWLFPRVQLLIAPVSDATLLDTWAIPVSYLAAALFVTYFASLVGILCGSSKARAASIAVLSVIAIMAILDSIWVIVYTLELQGKESITWSTRNVWGLAEIPFWVLWAAFNYWYFFKRSVAPGSLGN